MKSVHLLIPDLFLPGDIASEACIGLRLPCLEKLLARGILMGAEQADVLRLPLENYLCKLFSVPCQADAPIAAISAAFDGLSEGCWLRADPVNLRLQRDQLLLSGVALGNDEAAQFCASLNAHFTGQGLEFFAPHPQRWYVRLDTLPDIRSKPFSEVLRRDVRKSLPAGEGAVRWHQLLNEIQMLLFDHPVNRARELRGELTINSVWFWGAGKSPIFLQKSYDRVSSDDPMVEMFAAAANIPFTGWSAQWKDSLTPAISRRERGFSSDGKQLLVWTGLRSALQQGDLAGWRTVLQTFETSYAQPLWQALRGGKLERLQLDILGEDDIRRMQLKRGDTWAFWRRARRLSMHSLV